MIEYLRETALVGTEKKPLDVAALPEAVGQCLPAADPETQFLHANALLNFYKLAGQYPQEYKSSVDDIIIDEDKSLAPDALQELYPRFALVDHQLRDAVVRLWLGVVIRLGGIVSPEILVNLIRDGQNSSIATKAMIIQVIGNKGAWILRNDTTLSYPIPKAGLQTWAEGTTPERKAVFAGLHASDPVAAIEMLQSTWSTESVVTKKVFLELLNEDLKATDVPFIAVCYREFDYQPKEKKTERECRRLLSGMLLRISTSSVYQSTTERLDKYFLKKGRGLIGMVTGKETVSLHIPEIEDDFWNAKAMDETFGFESKGFDIALFASPQLYWLSCLLQSIPMAYWARHFDGEYSRCVEYWLTNTAFTTIVSGAIVSINQQALRSNAQIHRDHQLANVLVNRWNAPDTSALLPVLEPKDFEKFIANNDHWDNAEMMGNGPYDAEHSWSTRFSERVIEHVYDAAMKNKPSGLGKIIAQFAHPHSLDALYRFNEKARSSTLYNVWSTGIFQVAHTPIEIRNKIKAITN